MTRYGRKEIKGVVKNKNLFVRRLIASWLICVAVGLLIGCVVGCAISAAAKEEPQIQMQPQVQMQIPTAPPKMEMEFRSGSERGFVPLNVPLDEEMQEYIYSLCYANEVRYDIVMALINQESSFRANVISDTNDFGLMQINEINHGWLSDAIGVTDFLDPHQNVQAGIFILGNLFDKYKKPSKALMAYNMGETGASRLWEQGIFKTDYSKSIMKKAAEYKQEILKGGE